MQKVQLFGTPYTKKFHVT